jgi:hypothetical protein
MGRSLLPLRFEHTHPAPDQSAQNPFKNPPYIIALECLLGVDEDRQ